MNDRTELTPHEIDRLVATARRRGTRKLAVRRVGSSLAAIGIVTGLAVGVFTVVDRNDDVVAPGDQPAPVVQSEDPAPTAPDPADEELQRVIDAREDAVDQRQEVEQEVAEQPTVAERNNQATEIALGLLPQDARYRLGEQYLPEHDSPVEPTNASLIMEDDLGALKLNVQIRHGLGMGTCEAPLCSEVPVEGGVVLVLDGAADGKAGQQMTWQYNRDDGVELVLNLNNRTVYEYSDGSKGEEFTREGPLPMTTEDAVAFLTDPAWDDAVANLPG